jgi:hypothetical protein
MVSVCIAAKWWQVARKQDCVDAWRRACAAGDAGAGRQPNISADGVFSAALGTKLPPAFSRG